MSDLLAACPRLKLLVTSREDARMFAANTPLSVLPLALPDPQHLPDSETLSRYGAVALFLARARETQPTFQLTTDNAPLIVEICRRLDGLPLAIELAAARLTSALPASPAGPTGAPPATLDGWTTRSACSPAHPARYDRVELRVALRRGTAPPPPALCLRGWRYPGSCRAAFWCAWWRERTGAGRGGLAAWTNTCSSGPNKTRMRHAC